MARGRLLIVLVLTSAMPAASAAQSTAPYPVLRGTDAIVVDGDLREHDWQRASPIPLALEWFPGDNTTPPVRTECRVLQDATRLLIGCRADDPDPTRIRASLADRDELAGDDQLIILLDASADRRTAYRFAVNAAGVQGDALLLQGSVDDGWDTIWEAETRIDQTGWTAEIAIPFRSIQFPARNDEWGVVIERVWPRDARRRFGNVQLARDETCVLCRAATLIGLGGIRSGNEVELNPALTALGTNVPRGADPGARADVAVEAGLTAQWNPTPSTRIVATVNPDFSHVEADADELDVTARFTIQLPEKRPFFTEGMSFFETFGNLDLVFTRSVADPSVGVKTTGISGAQSYGLLLTRDETNNLLLPGSQRSDLVTLDSHVLGGMGRYRLDVGRSSSVGAIATVRKGDDYSNLVFGLDGILRRGSHRLRYLVAGSHTGYPALIAEEIGRPGEALADGSAFGRYDFDGKRWAVEASYRATGDDFRADAGFVPRVGVRGPEVQVTRTLWGDGAAWFDRIRVAVDAQDLRDAGGAVLDRKIGSAIAYEGPLQSEIEVGIFRRRNRFQGEYYDLTGAELSFALQPRRNLDVGGALAVGDEIDSDNLRAAGLIDARLAVRFRPGHRTRIRASYRWQRLAIDAGTVFSAHLPQAHIEYHFARDLFVRGNVQYRSVSRAPELFLDSVDPLGRRVFTQLLFAWRANPRTLLFAGYSDTLEGTPVLASQGRAVFVKLSYGWRL